MASPVVATQPQPPSKTPKQDQHQHQQADLLLRKSLSRIATHPTLSPFRRRVYRTLLSVPRGRWTTYSALARHLSSGPRAIGSAMKNNPFAPAVPCHRVLANDRSLGGYKGAWNNGGEYSVEKRKLLDEEGVVFDEKGRAGGLVIHQLTYAGHTRSLPYKEGTFRVKEGTPSILLASPKQSGAILGKVNFEKSHNIRLTVHEALVLFGAAVKRHRPCDDWPICLQAPASPTTPHASHEKPTVEGEDASVAMTPEEEIAALKRQAERDFQAKLAEKRGHKAEINKTYAKAGEEAKPHREAMGALELLLKSLQATMSSIRRVKMNVQQPSTVTMRSLILTALVILAPSAATAVDYSQYVNAFIGSEGPTPGQGSGGGDIFVGAARPFGVVKFGLDSTAANWTRAVLNGGWTPDGNVTAFTMMHESGTGGEPKYGCIGQFPLGSLDAINILDNTTYAQPRVGKDTATVGYFKTTLQNGVVVELSASRHAGIITYSFPSGEKYVLVDVSHYLPGSPGDPSSQFYVGGEIEINDDGKSYQGYGTYIGGFNNGGPFTVYFYGEFSTDTKSAQVFSGANTDPIPRYHVLANGGIPQPVYGNQTTKVSSGPMNDRVGALFSWDNDESAQISSRIGISFISTAKAKAYIASEIPSWKVNDTVSDAVAEWNRDVFSKIRVPVDDSANMTHVRLLYSSLYFTHLMPSDRTGENPLWESSVPSWDDFYTLWDIFRCTVSLYHIIQPTYYESMIRGIVDIYTHEGFMPDGRSGNWNGLTQGGSDADNVLADAYVKGLRGAINWTEAYAAMVKDAEVIPYNTFDPTDLTGSTKEGRGALGDWLELGYISVDRNSRSLSRTVEYSLNDFALSQVAAGVKPGDQQKYLKRSAGWQHVWDHEVSSLNFTGFLTPKLSNGTFNRTGYDPLYCGNCEWSAITYEGVPWEYSFVIPHDMQTLIEFMGGKSTFESRLDTMFVPGLAKQNLGDNGAGITTLMNIGNEPDFMTPYLYHYINKQAKSVQQTRNLSTTYFKDAAYGVPGNSDAGAMNSWLIWQLLGLYPVVTQPVYLIGSPTFREVNMTVNINKTLYITASGLDQGFYVQSLKVNGKKWTKNWLEHDDVFVNGGSIEFELGKHMKNWDTGAVPPSPGHYTV